jgi:NADPH:quinone reductase-like Zn-dependent oxidoreductase
LFGCLDTFFPYVREGWYAQFVAAKESQLAKMPGGVSFEEAAGVPLVALTAWQVG